MRFSDIIGHSDLKQRLIEGVRAGRVPHAQLFIGASGRGALPLALAYVQYLGCESPLDSDSCGKCPSCIQMEALSHPDLHIVMPVNKQGKKGGEKMLSRDFLGLFREQMQRREGYLSPTEWYEALDLGKTLKGAISVDEADEIIRTLSFKSFSGEYKAMIIWLPEMMQEAAANKLLKVLEEPWERTLFILVTESSERLLQTILSRTQQLEIPPIEREALEEYAVGRGVERGAKSGQIARLSKGDLGEAKRLITSEGAAERREYFNLFTQLMRLSYNDKHLELMKWAEDISQLSRSDQLGMLRYSLMMLREAYIRHAGVSEICHTWGEEAEFCTKFAPYIGSGNIEFLIEEIELALRQLTQNASSVILFTHFALKVSRVINRL